MQIIDINPKGVEMFGYENREELVGQAIHVLVPIEHQKGHSKHTSEYIENPGHRAMGGQRNLEGLKKDGSTFPVEVSLSYYNDNGAIKIIALVTDISVRNEAEATIKKLNAELEQKVRKRTRQLKRSYDLYSQIARNFPNGTINVFDRDLNYVFVDGKELFQMGIKSEQLVGTNYIKRLPKEIRQKIEKILQEVFKGTSKKIEVEVRKAHYQYLLF